MDELLNVDLMPYTRILWKLWLDNKFKEGISSIARDCWLSELRSVSEGQRRCATTHIRSENIMEDLQLLSDMGLVFGGLRRCRRVQGFAHKFYDVPTGEPYDIYGVVAKDQKDVAAFREADGDHVKIGKLLGYPDCCVEHFNRVWPFEYDPIWSAAKNTTGAEIEGLTIRIKEFYPEANILLRYFGIRAVPHLVCSLKCERSKEFANSFTKYIEKRELLMEILKAPLSWDCYRGAAVIRTKWFTGITNSMPYKERHLVFLGNVEGDR